MTGVKTLGPFYWDLAAAACCLAINEKLWEAQLRDGRFLNHLATLKLATTLFSIVEDDGGGSLLQDANKELFRLRIATDRLSLNVSANKGVDRHFSDLRQADEMNLNFIAIFTDQLPNPTPYLFGTDIAQRLRANKILDQHFEGRSGAVLGFLLDELHHRQPQLL